MLVISFVEGAPAHKGGIGIVGVPLILGNAAERGHRIVLLMCGPPSPGREQFVVPDIESALKRRQGEGYFGTVVWKMWNKWGFSPGLMWQAAKYVRKADFVTLHSLYSFPVLAGYLLARLFRKPYALWPHGVLAPVQREISADRKRLYDRVIGRRILDNASALVFSAAGEFEEAKPVGLKPPCVIVPDCVDLSEFAQLPSPGGFRERWFPGFKGSLVVCLGRLNAKKGLDLLIQAMARIVRERPDTRLAIVGPSDPPGYEQTVMNWIRESGIESQVVLTGPVDQRMKYQLLADADVLVSASHAENFGFSVFEAMASRVPVVISETLNFAEEISRHGAGLSARRDPADFAAAIIKLLDSASLRKETGARGADFVSKFSRNETGELVERTLLGILGKKLGREPGIASAG